MALPNMGFWDWLKHIGAIGGQASYYTDGKASEAEYRHALEVATTFIQGASDPAVKGQFYEYLTTSGAIQGDPTYYSSGKADAGAVSHALDVSAGYFSGGGKAKGSTAATSKPKGITGLMSGGQTIRVKEDGVERFYQVYEWPVGSGTYMSFQFNDRAQAEATLGKGFDVSTWTAAKFTQRSIVQASAEEANVGGSFTAFTNNLMRDAAAAAGIRDPGLIGRIASNTEMQQIMAKAVAGDWTQDQVRAEQRRSNFWKNELYPGIDAFYGSTSNPEAAWAEYRADVTPALRALGYVPDANGTFNAEVKRMLDGKIDSGVFLQQVPTFIQATQNVEFATVLNSWAEQELGRTVGFNDWFDLMAGEGQPDLEGVAEKAQLAYQAQTRGAQVTENQIRELAARTQLTAAEQQATFADFNQAILALGELGLQRGGLSRDDVLSAAAGITTSGGRSVDEVKLQVAKLARENDLFDNEKINFYVGYDPMGRPQRPGLQGLAPESA